MNSLLLIEESPIVREPMAAVLAHEGYKVLCASDGAEALSVLSQSTPDLILLDLMLPKVDGLALLSHINSTPLLRKTPVIVISAQTDRMRIQQAARLGIAAYFLKKHFSLRQVLDRIKSLLAGDRAACSGTPQLPDSSETSAGDAPRAPSSTSRPDAPKQTPRLAKPATLPPADPSEALRSLSPVLMRTEVLKRVERAGELRALSPTVTQVLKLTGNSRCSVELVAKAISQDHAIALKIMKLANSSIYTRGEPVDSVHKAVVRIGIERIRQAVLNISVVERFSAAAFDQFLSTEQFWEHSIACGIIATELAHATEPTHSETAFTLGLLHDVGRVIFAEQLGDEYLTVLQTASETSLPLEQIETRMLQVNHADIMDRILRLWNFSQDLLAPIVCHHLSAANVRSTAPRQLNDALRLGLANRITHALLLGSSGNESIYPIQEFCESLNISGDVIARIENSAREQTDDMRFAMLAHAGNSSTSWVHRCDAVRSQIEVPLNVLFVSDAPATDSYRIFCNQVRSPEQELPNIAVVHIAHARERTAVSNRLRTEEQSAGTGALPLIVISPGGKLNVEDNLLAGRPWATLPSPFTVSRFAQTVRMLLRTAEARNAA